MTFYTLEAWKNLLGHLLWVTAGVAILRWKQKPFFPKKGHWVSWSLKENWCWWTLFGYFLSYFLVFVGGVFLQGLLVGSGALTGNGMGVMNGGGASMGRGVMTNREWFWFGNSKDVVGIILHAVGPCISAPIFEEILYRGYVLPTLSMYLPLWAAIPICSVVFAVPHGMTLGGLVPLVGLGMVWSLLYLHSRNLVVPIVIHALWNSRAVLLSL